MVYKSHNLGWSNTRITLLEYCQKKYFFNYYTHALKNIDEKLRLKALLLKHLKSMEMRMGEKTHHLLSDYLRVLKEDKVATTTVQTLKDEVTEIMKKEFEISKNRDFTQYDKEHKFGLSEHFYALDAEGLLEETIQKVLKNLDAFLESEWHDKVKRYFTIAKNVFVENPKIPDYENMKVNVENIPELRDISVLASPDFGVIFDDNDYLILDRKSGKESFQSGGISDQLKVYVLKMLLKKGTQSLSDIKVKVHEIYFPSMHMTGGEIAQKDIDDIVQKIIQDVNFQKQFIVDQNVYSNIALPHKNFQRTTSQKKCATCTFRKVCEELKELEE